MSKPKSVKEAIDIFERNYPRYDSEPAYKPSEIFKLSGANFALTPREAEDFIDHINGFLRDNDANEFINKIVPKLPKDGHLLMWQLQKDVFKDYVKALTNSFSRSEINELDLASTDKLSATFGKTKNGGFVYTQYQSILDFVEEKKLPLPDQIIDFYYAIGILVYHLKRVTYGAKFIQY